MKEGKSKNLKKHQVSSSSNSYDVEEYFFGCEITMLLLPRRKDHET